MASEDIDSLKHIKKEFNMTYSAHLPILSIDLASPNKFTRKGSIEASIDTYFFFKELENDIDLYILHPTGEVVSDIMNYFSFYPEIKLIVTNLFIDYSLQSIEDFIKITGIKREKIVIENIIFPFDATLQIIKELELSLCIDTAHFLPEFSGNHNLVEVAKNYLPLTKEIHLQDYEANYIREHAPLGTSTVFPLEFLKILKENEFQGPIVFELTNEEAITSLKYIKEHIPGIKIPEIQKSSIDFT
ncbi:MAG: TIM barrel protein [Promethearchaeota archaeon]